MDNSKKVVPLALLKLRGTHNPTRQGGDAPEIRPGDPSLPPAQRFAFPNPPMVNGEHVLGPVGLEKWEDVRRQWEATGVITQADEAVLYGYCKLYERGLVEPASMTGSLWTQLRMYLAELGFSPSARERLRRAQD